MRRHLFIFMLGCAIAAAGCNSTIPEPTVTPEVLAAVSPTEIPSTPTETSADPTATVSAEPEQPTAVPTLAATEEILPTVTPTEPPPPTATPIVARPADSFGLEFVAAGFVRPLGVEHAGDTRLFVIEQRGTIQIIEDGQVLATPFLDITGRVNSSANEQGLLGLAFHPDYANNGRFFLNYTGPSGETVIAEYGTADTNTADPNSERIILAINQPYPNHNGGQIRFGPDGFLYIGMGDGGSQNDPINAGQDLGQLLGSMLRIDIDNGEPYAIPGSNPYVTNDNARNEIWAKGLRNPWRFSFDRVTGDLYIADVGQNVFEEINFAPGTSTGAENYGWRIFEAAECYIGDCSTPGLSGPIGLYNHADGHCSVTGGYVYRGDQEPALYGNYFFADYCSGTMWRLFPTDAGWDQAIIGNTGFLVSSFGEGIDGEIYVVNQAVGEIYRLTE